MKSEACPRGREADNRTAICVYWFIKLILYTLFGDYRRALGASKEFDRHKDTIQASFRSTSTRFSTMPS